MDDGLFAAAASGDVAAIREAIAMGADVDARDATGRTPVLVATQAAVLFALVLGIPSLRLRADYLAIATVAGAEIVRYLALNMQGLTGGPIGSIGMLGPSQLAQYNQLGGAAGAPSSPLGAKPVRSPRRQPRLRHAAHRLGARASCC